MDLPGVRRDEIRRLHDPQGGDGDFANGQYASNDGTGWMIHTNVDPVPVHVMDLIVTAEGLFLFGAANTPDPPNGGATVWHSPDDGATWDVSLAPRPDPTNIARFYAATVVGGDLYAVLDDGAGGMHVYQRTGGVWAETETLGSPVSGLIPFAVNGVDFAVIIPEAKQDGISQSGTPAVLTALADTASRPGLLARLPATVRDATVASGLLYVLDGDYRLWRIDSGGTRTALFTSTIPVCSVAIAGGFAYFGTSDSKVYKAALPT